MSELEHKRRMGPVTDAEVAARLLAAAKPVVDAAREAALLERIMAAAERSPRLAAISTTPLTPPAAPNLLRRPAPRRDLWAAAGVLAASLVIGFVAGQMSLPYAAMQQVAEASGISLTSVSSETATLLGILDNGDDD